MFQRSVMMLSLHVPASVGRSAARLRPERAKQRANAHAAMIATIVRRKRSAERVTVSQGRRLGRLGEVFVARRRSEDAPSQTCPIRAARSIIEAAIPSLKCLTEQAE